MSFEWNTAIHTGEPNGAAVELAVHTQKLCAFTAGDCVLHLCDVGRFNRSSSHLDILTLLLVGLTSAKNPELEIAEATRSLHQLTRFFFVSLLFHLSCILCSHLNSRMHAACVGAVTVRAAARAGNTQAITQPMLLLAQKMRRAPLTYVSCPPFLL